MDTEFVLTQEGYERLRTELEQLQVQEKERKANFADVNYSLDTSREEAAYFETRVEKEHTEERIRHLQYVLENARVLDDNDPLTVDPGDRVTVYDLYERETIQFDLLNGEEIIAGRSGISLDSPVGSALLGCRVGDVVDIKTPNGIARYAIRKIEPIPSEEQDTRPSTD